MKRDRPLTYWDYIAVEELLSLQTGIDEREADLSNDEVMFITIHQIDELWFKLVLRELETVRDLFKRPHVPEQTLSAAARGIRRMAMIFGKLTSHFELMETMTTRDYLGFRDKLTGASGFQSAQLRELEILLGLKEEKRLPYGTEKSYKHALREADGSVSPALARVERRLADRPTLHEAIREWLYRTPIDGSRPEDPGDEETVDRFLRRYADAHAKEIASARGFAVDEAPTPDEATRLDERFGREIDGAQRFLFASDESEEDRRRARRIRAALVFIESYRELPLLAWPREVLEALVAFEQAFVVFRQRHARMVERVIGRRTGTGGSAGVEYLDQTALRYRIFEDLWAVRTLLIRREALPALGHPQAYGLAPED
jgi:tryptophan 2,3-dioxygenase